MMIFLFMNDAGWGWGAFASGQRAIDQETYIDDWDWLYESEQRKYNQETLLYRNWFIVPI